MTEAKIYEARNVFRYHDQEMDSDIELRRKGILDYFTEYNALKQMANPTEENINKAYSLASKMLHLSTDIIDIENRTKAALARLDEILYPDSGD